MTHIHRKQLCTTTEMMYGPMNDMIMNTQNCNWASTPLGGKCHLNRFIGFDTIKQTKKKRQNRRSLFMTLKLIKAAVIFFVLVVSSCEA